MEEGQNLVTAEPVLETQIVCRMFGKAPGHHEHKWKKEGLALTKRYKQTLTDNITGSKDAAMELPYRIQVRLVSPWNDIDGNA